MSVSTLKAWNEPGHVRLWTMTSEQFAALPECEQRLELLDGVVYLAVRPWVNHQMF